MRNVQKEFFERSLKRQGVVVIVNGVETKALIINNKDIKTGWCYSDIILPYEIKAEIGDIIHVGDKRFFICNKDTQYDIRNLYRCCENTHYVRFDYQNGTIKSAGLVTLTEDKVTSLFDNSLLELAKGVAIFFIKHTANTEQIEVGDRFVLMNRAYEVIGCTWGMQNLIKLELEKSTWGVDDDKENGIIVNKRDIVIKEEPDVPDVPEPIVDEVVGDNSIDVDNTVTYTITNSTNVGVVWSLDNTTTATITSSDNYSCTVKGLVAGTNIIKVTYPTGEVFTKEFTITRALIVDEIVGNDSVDVGATATYTITNTTGANVTWSVDNANVTITSSDNTSCTIEGVTDGSVTISVAYPTGEVFSKSVVINKVITYDIDAYGELGDWSLQTVESGNSLSFINTETDTYFLGGNKIIYKSEDKGATWEKIATPPYAVKDMAIGQYENIDGVMEDRYAIVGGSKLTGYSNDKGVTWNFYTDEVEKNINEIEYIGGRFIGASYGRVGVSFGGKYYNDSYMSDTTYSGQKLDYVNGKWVICGTKGRIAIADSYEDYPTGSDFTIVDTGVGSISFTRITYSKHLNLYVLVGTNGTIVTSPDLVTFTTVASGLTGYGGAVMSFLDCIYANQMFIAVGNRKTIYTSRDGVNWTSSVPCGTSTTVSISRIIVDKYGKVFMTLSDGTIATNQFTII